MREENEEKKIFLTGRLFTKQQLKIVFFFLIFLLLLIYTHIQNCVKYH